MAGAKAGEGDSVPFSRFGSRLGSRFESRIESRFTSVFGSRVESRFEGAGVLCRLVFFSGGASNKKSLLKRGVEGRLYFSGECGFSGEVYFSGDFGDEDNIFPPSIKLLRSFTLDCIRLCPEPLEVGRSGDPSMRFG